MTKQQNRLSIICISLCILAEIVVAIGAFMLNYFTKKRMGMLRHVVFLNGKWEKLVNITIIKWIAIGIITFSIILICILYLKQHKHLITTKIVTLITILVSLMTAYYLLFFNTTINRSYYLMSICFMIATVFQHIVFYCYYIRTRIKK